ncbi:hypothetical protein D3C76_1026490 [compost metagenome]
MFIALRAAVEDRADHQQGKHPQRQVDVENPAPGGMLHQKAADQRADHRRQTKDPAEQTLITAAIRRRDHIRHRRHADHHQPAAA